MVDHHATIPNGMSNNGGQPTFRVRDPRFNDKLNLWELAGGKGSDASKESARLLIGYLSLLGVVSVYSPIAMLWTGIILIFIPVYHFCVNEYTVPGVTGRVGDYAIKTGLRAGITLRDSGMRFMSEHICLIGQCSSMTADLVLRQAKGNIASAVDAYVKYARLLSDRALYVSSNGATSLVRTSRRRFIPREKEPRVDMNRYKTDPGTEIRITGKENKFGVMLERWKRNLWITLGYRYTKEFVGCGRLGLLHKLENDIPLSENETLTMVHDIAIIRGEDINFAGFSFDGADNNRMKRNHLQFMFCAFDWSDIDCYGGHFAKDGLLVQ